MDVRAFNGEAWNRLVDAGDRWTIPVNPEEIARARVGEWNIPLTPTRPVVVEFGNRDDFAHSEWCREPKHQCVDQRQDAANADCYDGR
jgi:hypothetical protein